MQRSCASVCFPIFHTVQFIKKFHFSDINRSINATDVVNDTGRALSFNQSNNNCLVFVLFFAGGGGGEDLY